jgi:hypothetical protein
MNKRLKKQRISNKNIEEFKDKHLNSSFFERVFSKFLIKNISIIKGYIVILVISILASPLGYYYQTPYLIVEFELVLLH